MKLSLSQRKNFVLSWLKPKPVPVTVKDFTKAENVQSNHEMWRTCNSCGDHFDVRKELKFICPVCGSNDIRIP